MNVDRTPAFEMFLGARNTLLRHRLDHESAVGEFRWPGLESFNWALDWFDVIADDVHRTALRVLDLDGEQSRSFDELRRRSDEVAAWLRDLGVERGDPVLLLLDNRVELWELLLALTKLRAIMVPTFTSVPREELAIRMDRASVRHVIAEADLASGLDVPASADLRISVGGAVAGWTDFGDSAGHDSCFAPDGPTGAGEPLFYYFTSGTTSRPKLVVHTHVSYSVGHLTSMYWHGLRPGDVHLNVSPPGWAKHPWSSLFAPWNAEATLVSLPASSTTAERILDALERTEATSLCASPSTWRSLIRSGIGGYRVKVREAVSVGEPLTEGIVESVRNAWGVRVRNGYGQSEITALAGVAPGLDVDPTSLGRPLPGYRLVLCEPGTEQPRDEGELCVDLTTSPVGMMRGYLDGPAGNGCSTHFYRTGDLAKWDEHGCLEYLGRLKDVHGTASGQRIAPVVLERLLLTHPAVEETAVLALGASGEYPAVKAFVVPAEHWNATAVTAEALLAHADQRSGKYRGIDVVEFVDDLPRTESGKVHRDALRNLPRSSLVEFSAGPHEADDNRSPATE